MFNLLNWECIPCFAEADCPRLEVDDSAFDGGGAGGGVGSTLARDVVPAGGSPALGALMAYETCSLD